MVKHKKQQDLSRTLDGKLKKVLKQQIHSSRTRGHTPPNYTREEGIEYILTKTCFKELYEVWKYNNFARHLAPSIDRIDSNLPYTLDNIQVCAWNQNQNNYGIERKKGLVASNHKKLAQYTLSGDYVAIFDSIREAEKVFGRLRISEQANLTTNNASAKGFQWREVTTDSYKDNIGKVKTFIKKVLMIDSTGEIIKEFQSTKEAMIYLGVRPTNNRLTKATGKDIIYKDHIWKYKGD